LSNNCGLRCNVLTCVLLAYYATTSGRNLLVFLPQLILSASKSKMEAASSFETPATTSKIVHCTTQDKCYMPIYVYACTTQVPLKKKIMEQKSPALYATKFRTLILRVHKSQAPSCHGD